MEQLLVYTFRGSSYITYMQAKLQEHEIMYINHTNKLDEDPKTYILTLIIEITIRIHHKWVK